MFRIINTFTSTLGCVAYHLLVYLKLPVAPRHVPVNINVLLVKFLTLILIIKDFIVIILTCVQYERLYISMEEAQSACIQRVMKANCSKSLKRLSKRVMQENRNFSKTSAYGLFTIDANLPMPLVLLTANYIIVLLQFAFL